MLYAQEAVPFEVVSGTIRHPTRHPEAFFVTLVVIPLACQAPSAANGAWRRVQDSNL